MNVFAAFDGHSGGQTALHVFSSMDLPIQVVARQLELFE